MLATQVTEQTVIHVPTLIRVWQEREHTPGWQVMVYVSLLIGPLDKIYRPVKDLLDSLGVRLVSQVAVEDPTMMWGQAVLSVYRVEPPAASPDPPAVQRREKARAA
jgi:Gene product 70